MSNIEVSIARFLLIYLLLILILLVMKKCKMSQTKLLFVASLKMTFQLVLAGLLLEYIFNIDSPIYTFAYLVVMIVFTIHRILSKNKWLNSRFKLITVISVLVSNLFIIVFFISVVAGQDLGNPQYMIPIGGMVLGNTMTAMILGLNAFRETLDGQRYKINALICAGASSKNILLPCVRQALETATLPTLNSMLGMGIVHLPGMMTGQILAGAVPITAIMYQIAIMIAICAANILACFIALYFGYQTIVDHDTQIIRFDMIEMDK